MNELSHAFRGLGDPTRLRILRLVSEAPLNVSELVSLVGVAQPSVSHHLGKLKGLGLIQEERQSGFSYYSLAINQEDGRWPLIRLAKEADDESGDLARLADLCRSREDRQALNEKLLEPGQSWFLWSNALSALLPKLDVVDFGCGTGVLSVSMARWAKRVTAVDSSATSLAKARERARREKLRNITFLREDLHNLSIEAGSMDLVVISQSLHHVERPHAVLEQAARILKPGGKLVVLELMPHDEQWVKKRLGHQHLGFEPRQIERMLKDVGIVPSPAETYGREGGAVFRVFLIAGAKQ